MCVALIIAAGTILGAISFMQCYKNHQKAKVKAKQMEMLKKESNAFLEHQKAKHKAFRDKQK